MDAQTFFIRSVMVQNIIMGIIVIIVVAVLIHTLRGRKPVYIAAAVFWAGVALWFFNGPLWGFSAVTVSQDGIELHYGFLSVFRNTTLPVDTKWKIRKYLGGIRKLKNLYYFELKNHQSLKVRGPDKMEVLSGIGEAIDKINGKPMGGLIERPINM